MGADFATGVDYAKAPAVQDIAIVGRKLAIFVDGEFWHGKKHTAERYAEMTEYWRTKIARNMERDRRVNDELRDLGWTIIRVTDRAVNGDVSAIADFVESAAAGRFDTIPRKVLSSIGPRDGRLSGCRSRDRLL